MNPVPKRRCDEYRELRLKLGTQAEVAALLGLTERALSDREMGHTEEIRQECFLALMWLTDKYEPRAKRSAAVRMI